MKLKFRKDKKMADLSLEQAQRLIQEYKSIIRLLESKTADFSNKAKKFDEFLSKLEKLENSNFSAVESITKLYDITDTFLKNLDASNQKFDSNVTNLNKIVESANEKIQNTIKNSAKFVDTTSIKSEIESQLNEFKKEIADAIKGEKNELDKLNDKLKNNVSGLKYTNEEIYSAVNKMKDTAENLNETKENLNDEIKKVNFKLTFFVAIVVAIITLFSSQYLYSNYEKPTITQSKYNKLKERLVPEKFICWHNHKKAFCFSQNKDDFDVVKSNWVYVYLTPKKSK